MKRGNLSPNNDLYCGYDYSSADTLTTDRGDRTVRTGVTKHRTGPKYRSLLCRKGRNQRVAV